MRSVTLLLLVTTRVAEGWDIFYSENTCQGTGGIQMTRTRVCQNSPLVTPTTGIRITPLYATVKECTDAGAAAGVAKATACRGPVSGSVNLAPGICASLSTARFELVNASPAASRADLCAELAKGFGTLFKVADGAACGDTGSSDFIAGDGPGTCIQTGGTSSGQVMTTDATVADCKASTGPILSFVNYHESTSCQDTSSRVAMPMPRNKCTAAGIKSFSFTDSLETRNEVCDAIFQYYKLPSLPMNYSGVTPQSWTIFRYSQPASGNAVCSDTSCNSAGVCGPLSVVTRSGKCQGGSGVSTIVAQNYENEESCKSGTKPELMYIMFSASASCTGASTGLALDDDNCTATTSTYSLLFDRGSASRSSICAEIHSNSGDFTYAGKYGNYGEGGNGGATLVVMALTLLLPVLVLV